MAGVVVPPDGIAGPGSHLGGERLHLGMGHHRCTGSLHLSVVLRPVEQVDQGPIVGPRLVRLQ